MPWVAIIRNVHTGKEENRSDPLDNIQDARDWANDAVDEKSYYQIRVVSPFITEGC